MDPLIAYLLLNETFEKCSISFKFKKGENFNNAPDYGSLQAWVYLLALKEKLTDPDSEDLTRDRMPHDQN